MTDLEQREISKDGRFVKPAPHLDVWIGAFGQGRNDRVTIIKTGAIMRDDEWEKISNGRIILAGSVKPDLMRLLQEHGRDAINELTATDDYPSGMISSGTTYDRLRHHLGLTEFQK
jgi:hypothetical protein